MRFSRSTDLVMFLSLEILASIIRICLPSLVELIDLVNFVIIFFVISNNLTQMVNFPTQISDCSHRPALSDLFISSGPSICSTMAFLSFRNSNHVVASVSIDFPLNSQQDAPISWHSLSPFSCWLGWSLSSFERCSMGGYL